MPNLGEGDMNAAKQLQADFKRSGTYHVGAARGGSRAGPTHNSGHMATPNQPGSRGTLRWRKSSSGDLPPPPSITNAGADTQPLIALPRAPTPARRGGYSSTPAVVSTTSHIQTSHGERSEARSSRGGAVGITTARAPATRASPASTVIATPATSRPEPVIEYWCDTPPKRVPPTSSTTGLAGQKLPQEIVKKGTHICNCCKANITTSTSNALAGRACC